MVKIEISLRKYPKITLADEIDKFRSIRTGSFDVGKKYDIYNAVNSDKVVDNQKIAQCYNLAKNVKCHTSGIL